MIQCHFEGINLNNSIIIVFFCKKTTQINLANHFQKILFLPLILLVALFQSFWFSENQNSDRQLSFDKVDSKKIRQNIWADSILATMTLEQKIGQLFMISAFSNRNETDYNYLENQIKKYHIGGLIFFQGNPMQQAVLTNRYQAAAEIPLLIGIDGEWGLGMRLDQAVSFPKAITLGATYNPEIVEKVGFEIGQQCHRMGIHINFGPDADINSNPKNPVINYRSFGEAPQNVSNLASAFARGLKNAGIMASAKHFPGHGDTETDSHHALPLLKHTKQHIDDIESVPFRRLIQDSIASVMVGHLEVPALEPTPNMPASVSEKVINQYLKKQLGYKGLVITDAMNMRGLLRYFPTGKAEVEAFKAGNDILLQTANIETAYNELLKNFQDSTLSVTDLDQRVLKILKAKYQAGLNQYKPIDYSNLLQDLNKPHVSDLIQEVFDEATTLVRDNESLVPIQNLNNLNYALLTVGAPSNHPIHQIFDLYGVKKSFNIPFKPTKPDDWEAVVEQAAQNDLVIVTVHGLHNLESRNFGLTNETLDLIVELQSQTKVIVCVFGNPYVLKNFSDFDTIICGFEDEKQSAIAVANMIFGVKPAKGKIPVNTLSFDGKIGDGLKTLTKNRIGFGAALSEGMDADQLATISPIMLNAIRNEEFPGAQVLVARNGKVVYFEAFGNLRYGFDEPVTLKTDFDLASLTKVTATVQAVMMLYNQKKLDIEKPIKYYLPEVDSTDKGNILLKDLLLHQAGLRPFIPFYSKTISGGQYSTEFYAETNPENKLLTVYNGLFIKPAIKDSVLNWIKNSTLISSGTTKRYAYSDLGLILLQRVVEKITKRNLDDYLYFSLYQPLGMERTGFNILKKLEATEIAPTEIDNHYRKGLIRGTVHDQNAALLGGVAGHAGLFSNAWDLAKLFQMNLNKGKYDGKQYFLPATIDYFTKNQSDVSHRGLGWNKPPEEASLSENASEDTYGHTGFTGTAAWVDPQKNLIYIFLSNRVYPSADNNKLIKYRTRKKVHDVIYKAIVK